MPITKNQVAMLCARMSSAGLKSASSKLDWLYERGVDVGTLDGLSSSPDISHQKLNDLLDELPPGE